METENRTAKRSKTCRSPFIRWGMYCTKITRKMSWGSPISTHFATRGKPNSYSPNPDKATNGTAESGLMNLVTFRQRPLKPRII
nr:hypothetical protein Iba_chr07eCG9450 [Ipomoea batatas]